VCLGIIAYQCTQASGHALQRSRWCLFIVKKLVGCHELLQNSLCMRSLIAKKPIVKHRCRAGKRSRNVENCDLFTQAKACKFFLFQLQHSHFEKHESELIWVDSSVICQILTYYIIGSVSSRVSEVVRQSHLSVRDMCTNCVCPVINV
jgi:hypothetical protein